MENERILLIKKQDIEIIGGGLLCTEIEIEVGNEEYGEAESDKEAVKNNIKEIEYLKAKKGKASKRNK